MAQFAVTVIGSGSALPMHGRNPSAQVVQYEDAYYLIDCGEGTQNRLRSSGIKPFKIKVILISHLHGDHFFGLPGLLSSFSHLQRKESLTVFGPEGIKGLLDEIMKYTEMKINYPLSILERTPIGLDKIWTQGNLDVFTFPLHHRVKCNGYLFKEKSPLFRLRKEIVEPLKLNPDQIHELMKGLDIEIKGTRISNLQLTYGEEQPLSYAYCSDTRYDRKIIDWIKNVTLLYHETTFKNDLLETAEQTGHTTAAEAGRLAKEAGVSCLLTGHYSSRYKDVTDLIQEAEIYFPHVLESIEGTRYSLRQLVPK
jgi:ribonuclease Z